MVEVPVFTKEFNTHSRIRSIEVPLVSFPGFWLGSVGFMVVRTMKHYEFTG